MKSSIRLKEAKKILSSYSPLILIAEKLKLKFLIKEKNQITGPAVGLSILIDKLTKSLPIKSMLDLCCGTGALTKIALKNKVKLIDCLDLNIKIAKANVKTKKVNFIRKDVTKLKIEKFYDLIVLDAPLKILPKIFNKFKEFVENSHLFVVWHGSTEEIEWNELVREKLRNAAKIVYSFSIYGEEISIATSSEKGMKWLKKFYKDWK
ncbi:MAG: methyltransferase [Candidatus Aenigmatarchaeota archaeon]|jgi:trans-aconitate methyltransferase